MDNAETKKKKFGVPHIYTLLTIVIIICAILTYIVPAGNYDTYVNDDGRTLVDPETFHYVDKTPVTPFGVAKAVFDGMYAVADIIFLVFIMGSSIAVMVSTGAVQALLVRIAMAIKGKEKLVIPVLMAYYCFLGCTTGAAEGLLVYIPIVLPLCLALGFDSLTAAGIILIGAGSGFMGSMMNPYTEGVAQGIAELPLFSGAGFRSVMLVVFFLISVIFIWRHASKVKANPQLSPVYEIDQARDEKMNFNLEENPFGFRQVMIVLGFLFSIVMLVYGSMKLKWWYGQFCADFFLMSIWAAAWGGLTPSQWGERMAKGMADVAVGALVVGFARGILVVLTAGNIMHTLLHACAGVLGHFPSIVSAGGMYIVQCLMNILVPSGSGQAAVTMPLMAPLADLVGVTRQTACVAFQIGDGLTNVFTPTSGYFMAFLGLAKIPWDKWMKAYWPILLTEFLAGMAMVLIAHMIHLGPF